MTDRIPCQVPGCRRTARPDGITTEIICGKHWSGVSKHLRRRYAKVKRRSRKDARWQPLAWRIWERCKKQAIEEALMGFQL